MTLNTYLNSNLTIKDAYQIHICSSMPNEQLQFVNINEKSWQLWAWCYLTHWNLMTHICNKECVTIGSGKDWLVTCLVTRHYLDHWWLMVNWNFWKNNLYWNLNQNAKLFSEDNTFQKAICKVTTVLFRPQCVRSQHIKLNGEYLLQK